MGMVTSVLLIIVIFADTTAKKNLQIKQILQIIEMKF